MKFNNIIANPPYNMGGKGAIYHKCINEMLKITDCVTVICPNALLDGYSKNVKGKIKFYSHKGVIWKGVGANVSIFVLDNNHNSLICETDEMTYKEYFKFCFKEGEKYFFDLQKKAEILQKKGKFGGMLFDYRISTKEELMDENLYEIYPQKFKNSKKDGTPDSDFVAYKFKLKAPINPPDSHYVAYKFSLKSPVTIAVDFCNIKNVVKAGEVPTAGSCIFKLENVEQADNLSAFLKTKTAQFLAGLLGGYRIYQNIPLPCLNDPKIADDDYLCELYEIQQWEKETKSIDTHGKEH
jgi:hypothetical protein